MFQKTYTTTERKRLPDTIRKIRSEIKKPENALLFIFDENYVGNQLAQSLMKMLSIN